MTVKELIVFLQQLGKDNQRIGYIDMHGDGDLKVVIVEWDKSTINIENNYD